MATNEEPIGEHLSREAGEEMNSNKFVETTNDIKPHKLEQQQTKEDDASEKEEIKADNEQNIISEKVEHGEIQNDEALPPTNTTTDTSQHDSSSPQQNNKAQSSNTNDENANKALDDDDDLEEGELKDDDDDDVDEDDDELGEQNTKNLSSFNNNDNNSGFAKESSSSDQRQLQQYDSHLQNYPSHHHGGTAGGQGPPHGYHSQQQRQHIYHNNRRQMSPNDRQHFQPEMYGSNYGPNHQPHFGPNNNNNHYRFPPNHECGIGPPIPPHHMDQHMMAGPGMDRMYHERGGVVLTTNVNRCRFYYNRNNNKCTWGALCNYPHINDDDPGPKYVDHRGSPGPPPEPGMPPMSPNFPVGRHQPYPPHPPLPPHGYGPYEPMQDYPPLHHPPYHHSTPPPPPYQMPSHQPHPRQQHSPYGSSSSSAHLPESVPAAINPGVNANSGSTSSNVPPASRGPSSQPPPNAVGPQPPLGRSSGTPSSPSYSSRSSSVVLERKHQLAYEHAPWNPDRHSSGGGYPSYKYDRPYPGAGHPPPSGGRGPGYYRNHYRDPYGRGEPMAPSHMGGPPGGPGPYPSAGYSPNYPSAYRGGPMGPHSSHHKYMSSSQRTLPPDSRRSRSNKRGHDEDESSWSDSGSEDSILGQASYDKSHQNKIAKRHHQLEQHQQQHQNQPPQVAPPTDNVSPKNPLDEGSGTPIADPMNENTSRQESVDENSSRHGSPEEDTRKELLLSKLKEIEDMMDQQRRKGAEKTGEDSLP